MKTLPAYLILLFSCFILSCGNDEGNDETLMTPDDDPEPVISLEAQREETLNDLGTSSNQVWRVESAQLTNAFGSFDISSNFNVADDEFIFTTSANSDFSVSWRQGNAINVEGQSSQETLLDYYQPPVEYNFNFMEDSSTRFSSDEDAFDFELAMDGRVKGTLRVNGSTTATSGRSAENVASELTLSLTPKLASDYTSPPANGLVFTPLLSFESTTVQPGSPDLIGSYADNSLYFATRAEGSNTERVIKYDVTNGSSTEVVTGTGDFITKRTAIINNELIIFGGQFVSTYPLELTESPASFAHGLRLTRYGFAVSGENMYSVGGDIDGTNSDKIYRVNRQTESLDLVASLPSPKSWADAEIVNDNLYVFSGQQQFTGTEPETLSYQYNFTTGNVSSFNMPTPLYQSYANRLEHLIYVAGQVHTVDAEGALDRDIFFGVYNTEDGSITEIATNLDDSDQLSTIFGMTIFNNKIYVIHGGNTFDNPTFSILEANLN